MKADKPNSFGFFFMIKEIAISFIIKTLREDATRAETKMHLRARTGAQRVTKWLFDLNNAF